MVKLLLCPSLPSCHLVIYWVSCRLWKYPRQPLFHNALLIEALPRFETVWWLSLHLAGLWRLTETKRQNARTKLSKPKPLISFHQTKRLKNVVQRVTPGYSLSCWNRRVCKASQAPVRFNVPGQTRKSKGEASDGRYSTPGISAFHLELCILLCASCQMPSLDTIYPSGQWVLRWSVVFAPSFPRWCVWVVAGFRLGTTRSWQARRPIVHFRGR